MSDVTREFAERGDLAHLALFLWASGASGLLIWALRGSRRVEPALQRSSSEIARLNRLFRDHS